jgi:hypothetical protein
MKVLLLLALTIFTVVSTVATVAITFNVSTPTPFSTTRTIVHFAGSRDIQPAGDPIDDPVLPD